MCRGDQLLTRWIANPSLSEVESGFWAITEAPLDRDHFPQQPTSNNPRRESAMLLHQGIGLDVFNELPTRKAVHALYECCNSVPLAADLAHCRPYADHDALFRQ